MILYGYEIRETTSRGVETTRVENCETSDDACRKCVSLALKTGWKPARWWQWWRWNDNHPPPHIVEQERAKLMTPPLSVVPRGTRNGQ